jgi:hypothetical protein
VKRFSARGYWGSLLLGFLLVGSGVTCAPVALASARTSGSPPAPRLRLPRWTLDRDFNPGKILPAPEYGDPAERIAPYLILRWDDTDPSWERGSARGLHLDSRLWDRPAPEIISSARMIARRLGTSTSGEEPALLRSDPAAPAAPSVPRRALVQVVENLSLTLYFSRWTTSQSLQWQQALGHRIDLSALSQTVAGTPGRQSRERTQNVVSVRTRPAKGWGLQGTYSSIRSAGLPQQQSYRSALTGALSPRWQLSANAARTSTGRGRTLRQQALALTGAPGVVGGPLRKTRLSFTLASSAGTTTSTKWVGKRPRRLVTTTEILAWTSGTILADTRLSRSLLTLGLQSFTQKGVVTLGSRLALQTPAGRQGSLSLSYENNGSLTPTRSLPDQRFAVAFRRRVTANCRLDLQTELRRWADDRFGNELAFRLNLSAAF